MRNKTLIIIGCFLVVIFLIMLLSNKKGFLVAKENFSLNTRSLLAEAAKLPVEAQAPALRGISDWINTNPLSDTDLRGKVVLVDFWTYSCINCIRTIPHLENWYEKYKENGFIILGVHSPEFDFEKKRGNVEVAVTKYGISYPVALDSEHKTWNAFGNQYWPAHYLIDSQGNIRYHNFGEGHYAETETAIQQLLLEAKLLTLDKITEIKEPPADTNFQNIGTPEIYLGYLRINNVGNTDTDVRADTQHIFSEPPEILPNRYYYVGAWTIDPEFSELTEGNGKLILRYKAGKVNIVAEAKDEKEIPAEIFLDGKLIGLVPISSPQLYNLIDMAHDYNWHTLEVLVPNPGFRVFTFTFG